MTAFPQAPLHALLQRLRPVLDAVVAAGGQPLVVGGAVRDLLLGHLSPDVDIEVHGLALEPLIDALRPLGKLNAVGRSFGVLKLRTPDGSEYDVALPQRESRNPGGQRGAMPQPDPSMTPREAAARRDFTWNALAITPDGTLLDFFGGQADLQAGVVRHVSDAFGDDPLRVLRAMRFAARFCMRLAPETADVCRALLPEAPSIARERVWAEWGRWAQAACPSAGLRALDASGWLALYPELAALQGCSQPPNYHPEGDVWAHTGYVCDAAAQIAERDGLQSEPRTVLVLAALCHDLGKPATTTTASDGRIRSLGHAEAGVSPAAKFLERIGAWPSVKNQVLPLVREHMAHTAQPSDRSVRRLAVRLSPSTIELWARLVEADHSGRPPLPPRSPAAAFVAHAKGLSVGDGPPPPLLRGRDLLAVGYPSGPELGALLRRVYQAQLDGAFATPEEGLAWLKVEGAEPKR